MGKVWGSILAFLMVMCFGLPSFAVAAKDMNTAKSSSMKVEKGRYTAFTKPETLNGTLSIVDTSKQLIVMKTADGTPFDFQTAGARILVNGKLSKLADLSADVDKTVTVKFVPRVSGDHAQTVDVGS